MTKIKGKNNAHKLEKTNDKYEKKIINIKNL